MLAGGASVCWGGHRAEGQALVCEAASGQRISLHTAPAVCLGGRQVSTLLRQPLETGRLAQACRGGRLAGPITTATTTTRPLTPKTMPPTSDEHVKLKA